MNVCISSILERRSTGNVYKEPTTKVFELIIIGKLRITEMKIHF